MMMHAGKIELPWGEMAYEERAGGEPVLVLLHGTFCDAADWHEVLDELPDSVRIINIEFRGHGASSVPTEAFSMADLADDVLALAGSLGIERMILVGHSLGGMVAMLVAAVSEKVAGLILLEGWSCKNAWSAFASGHNWGNLTETALVEVKRKCELYRSRFADDVWQAFAESVAAFDGRDFLRSAQFSVFEVYGTVGYEPARKIGLRVPENPYISWHWIQDAGHYLPHEKPAAVAVICRKMICG